MSTASTQAGVGESNQQLVAALEVFRERMGSYADYAFRKARYWSAFYWISRSLLIVFGIATSAEALNTFQALSSFKPYFGLAVALITAFEVLCKSETKYKGYYTANDSYDQLDNSIALLVPRPQDVTAAKLDELEKRYGEINKRLQAFIV